MADASARLINILLSSAFSFLGAGLFLLELWLVLKVIREIKLENYFRQVTNLARFVLALIITSLAFPTFNSMLTKYLNGFFGASAPLAKGLLAIEAVVFFVVLARLYKSRQNS